MVKGMSLAYRRVLLFFVVTGQKRQRALGSSLAIIALIATMLFGIGPVVNADNCYYANFDMKNSPDFLNPIAIVDIDTGTGNLMVRGPLPLTVRRGLGKNTPCLEQPDWSLAYDQMSDWIKNLIGQDGSCPSYFSADKCQKLKGLNNSQQPFKLSDYKLIVVTLLEDKGTNFNDLKTEMTAAGQNFPDDPGQREALKRTLLGNQFTDKNGQLLGSGSILWWPFAFWDCTCSDDVSFFCCSTPSSDSCCKGPYTATCCTGQSSDKCTSMDPKKNCCWQTCDPLNVLHACPSGTSTGGDFAGLIDTLHSLLLTKDPDKTRVIYFHCAQGVDRTGTAHLGYLLNNYTFKDAWKYARLKVGSAGYKVPNCGSQRVGNAYCRYLQAMESSALVQDDTAFGSETGIEFSRCDSEGTTCQ